MPTIFHSGQMVELAQRPEPGSPPSAADRAVLHEIYLARLRARIEWRAIHGPEFTPAEWLDYILSAWATIEEFDEDPNGVQEIDLDPVTIEAEYLAREVLTAEFRRSNLKIPADIEARIKALAQNSEPLRARAKARLSARYSAVDQIMSEIRQVS